MEKAKNPGGARLYPPSRLGEPDNLDRENHKHSPEKLYLYTAKFTAIWGQLFATNSM